jgi:hypothetical protein
MKELDLKLDVHVAAAAPHSSHSANMEVLTEYFGFSPIDFVDDIINTVNDLLYNAMDKLENLMRPIVSEQDLETVLNVCFKETRE